MGVTKKYTPFFRPYTANGKNQKGVEELSADLIAETKALNSYLVISDPQGNIKKIPAKDL